MILEFLQRHFPKKASALQVKEAVQQLPPTTDFQDPAAGQRGTELLSALQEALNASSDSPIQV